MYLYSIYNIRMYYPYRYVIETSAPQLVGVRVTLISRADHRQTAVYIAENNNKSTC